VAGVSHQQFSEDRQWWWTGSEWVPASEAPEAAVYPEQPLVSIKASVQDSSATAMIEGVQGETPELPPDAEHLGSIMPTEPIVQHLTGTVTIEDDQIVARLAGLSGMFNKKSWAREIRIPLANASARAEGDSLSLFKDGHPVEMLLKCTPQAAVELLINRINNDSLQSAAESGESEQQVDANSENAELLGAEPLGSGSALQPTSMPGATGSVRELPNGAIVSGNGYYYWSGWKWTALVENPPVKAPGLYSQERLAQLPKLVRGKSIQAMGTAGAGLRGLMVETGSLEAAELQLMAGSVAEFKIPSSPEDAIRSPDGTQWWDGAAWRPIAVPANAVRSPDGSSWWDGNVWQPVRPGIAPSKVPSAVTPTVPRLAARNQVRVKSYKNEQEFERDAKKMIRDGWTIEGQSSKDQKTAIMRTAGKAVLTGGIGLIVMGRSKKGATITVTWVS
jgi:hypothetical protein